MNLAIQGHSNRGNEVISYLEKLGGKNPYGCNGLGTLCAYRIIDGNIQIVTIEDLFKSSEYILYSLEGILAKFPYKIGDKVIYEDKIREITKMVWEEQTNTVAYKLDDKLYCNTINELQSYKEETMETAKITITPQHHWNEDKIELEVTNDYEIKEENGKYYAVKKQPKYPKTYEECCEVLGLKDSIIEGCLGYEYKLLNAFQKLLMCRDAYRKIAGEQMGMGKPWVPDWLNVEQDKYVLFTHNNTICPGCYMLGHNVLAFPTAEMRDAFKENFDPDIDFCKELL